MRLSDFRRPCAEFLGTALLVAVVIGSGIMGQQLSQGVDAVALLGNTIATAAALVVLITILGPISGAHFNPVVSLSFAIQGELPWRYFAIYLPAQLIGGLLGTVLAHAMFGQDLIQLGSHVRAGPGVLLGEIVATFTLLITIIGTLRVRRDAVAAMVGLVIAAGYWFTSSTSFANPAVTIARALTDSFAGIRPIDAPGFILAQLVGSIIATWCARWFWPKA